MNSYIITAQIYSYRIEHAININIRQNIMLKNILMTEGISCAIDIHCQAMKFVFNSQYTYNMFNCNIFLF